MGFVIVMLLYILLIFHRYAYYILIMFIFHCLKILLDPSSTIHIPSNFYLFFNPLIPVIADICPWVCNHSMGHGQPVRDHRPEENPPFPRNHHLSKSYSAEDETLCAPPHPCWIVRWFVFGETTAAMSS